MNVKLLEAVQDAQILLAHATRAGIPIDTKVVSTIVITGSLCSNQSVSDAEETAFWEAFNILAKTVNPVTVSSLSAIGNSNFPARLGFLSYFTRGRSQSTRAAQWYTGIAMLSLAILLLVQIYWLFGSAITNDILTNKKDYDETKFKISTIPTPTITKSISTDVRTSAELAILRSRIENIGLHGESSYNLLEVWSRLWEQDSLVKASCKLTGEENLGKIGVCEKSARFEAAVQVLNVLQRYFLPLLYGLLGACVYILRTLASQIRAQTYSETSNIDFRIRLYLGTLGGMVSAWFLTPEAADGLFKSLSPFAVAFLAGYSVELLFAAMDRIISAFTK